MVVTNILNSDWRLLSPPHIDSNGPARESLTSLIRRLCEHNQLALIDVAINMELPMLTTTLEHSHKIVNPIHLLNSGGPLSVRMINRLQQVAVFSNLENATLLQFQSIGGMQPLRSSRYRRWCPSCFEEDRLSSHGPYERLLWSIDCLELCPIHQTRLEKSCKSCGVSNFSVLSGTDISGYCPKCFNWLGAHSNSRGLYSDDHSRYLQWVASSFLDLLSSPLADDNLSGNNVTLCLKAVRDTHFLGRSSGIAKALGRSKSTLSTWLNGQSSYSWPSICQVSFALGIPLQALLLNDKDALFFCQIHPLPLMAIANGKTARKRKGTASISLFRCLIDELAKGLYPQILTLKAASLRIGLDQKTLRKNFPEMYKELATLLSSRVKSTRAFRTQTTQLSRQIAIDQLAEDFVNSSVKLTRRECSRRLGLLGIRPTWNDEVQIFRAVRDRVLLLQECVNSPHIRHNLSTIK